MSIESALMQSISPSTVDSLLARSPEADFRRQVLDESSFLTAIVLERKRADRSQVPFLLILFEAGKSVAAKKKKLLSDIADLLVTSTRETDITGWYGATTVGLLVTDLRPAAGQCVVTAILRRLIEVMGDRMSSEHMEQIAISANLYPEDWEYELSHRPSNPIFYPDALENEKKQQVVAAAKRFIDILGSIAGLVIFSPCFVLIPLAIKLTSPGPVLFRQPRVGAHGRLFMFYKFRSMLANNDADVHVQWFNNFISGNAERYPAGNSQNGIFKMTNDPRITPIGRLLRRTSLDELPQFLNVLRGDMSLVGPRPPIPYEVKTYRPWHRGRILQSKPGITGLWQVSGRSRVTFDEMVRLDIQYARNWSLLLDLKILLRTPKAVVSADGAY